MNIKDGLNVVEVPPTRSESAEDRYDHTIHCRVIRRFGETLVTNRGRFRVEIGKTAAYFDTDEGVIPATLDDVVGEGVKFVTRTHEPNYVIPQIVIQKTTFKSAGKRRF